MKVSVGEVQRDLLNNSKITPAFAGNNPKVCLIVIIARSLIAVGFYNDYTEYI